MINEDQEKYTNEVFYNRSSVALMAELARVRSEAKSDALDAARYRWLRVQPEDLHDATTPRIDVCYWTCPVNDEGIPDSVNDGEALRGENLDTAIDAAIKESKA